MKLSEMKGQALVDRLINSIGYDPNRRCYWIDKSINGVSFSFISTYRDRLVSRIAHQYWSNEEVFHNG